MRISDYVPLVTVSRGARGATPLVEGVHIGAIAVVDGTGALVAAAGSPQVPVHLRSTAKPFQLLPLVLDGIHTRPVVAPGASGRGARGGLTLTDADLAVMMASHSGQAAHTGRVARILAAAGLSEDQLQCGAHPPVHAPTAETLVMAGQSPGPLHNNCSGKHTNMLLTCQHNRYPLETYLDPEHPLQVRIRRIISVFSGVEEAELGLGVDGCSAPTFAMPLHGLARMFAHLAAPEGAPEVEGRPVQGALETLWAASTAHPFLVAGSGRLDVGVMESFGGRVMAKIGAMGAYVFGVRPGPMWPSGLGVAIKVLDGDASNVARPLVVAEVLRQLGLLEGDALPSPLASAVSSVVSNHRGIEVGVQRAVFGLSSVASLAADPGERLQSRQEA